MVLGNAPTDRLSTVAALYPPKADLHEAIVPDFHSLRQALNVASADQRVLVVIHGAEQTTQPLRESLKLVANDDRTIGRFHFDFESSSKSLQDIEGLVGDSGIALVRSGEFGLTGESMRQLPLNATPEEILQAMLMANEEFIKTTQKKSYLEHVSKGRKLGVFFEGAVPYGEDRDGDGEVDKGGSGRSSGRSSRAGRGQ